MSIQLAFDHLDGAAPERTIAFLHGVIGRGNNLRTLARRFIEARPDWTAWLVDLRGHGRSPKGTPGPTLEATAWDVLQLASQAQRPLAAIVGHSFGGKVALEAARMGEISTLNHVMLIDSNPGQKQTRRGEDSALNVIDTLESLPQTFASKSEFVEALLATGKSRELAQWLMQSVAEDNRRFRFALDLKEIRALVLDYLARDLWPTVENPPDSVNIHLVIGERSDVYPLGDRERAKRLVETNKRISVAILPAGHWVHVDDPDGLLEILLRRIV
jgi:pimeloyl-ACP methyl ester carboxylesterase